MAQTIEEIQADIIVAKEADANLSGLTSPSKVSIWLGWVQIVAKAIKTLQDLWDVKKAELEAAAESAVPGTESWYAKRVLEWQYGYPLAEDNKGKLYYLIQDDNAKLVKKVAAITVNRVLQIKVAKGSPLAPLSSAEKVSLDSYIKAIKFAGTKHVLISTNPDLVKLTGTEVYYDGKLDLPTFQAAFELALNNYLVNIFFNGYLNINKFRDAGEAVPGTVDFQTGVVEAKEDGGSYVNITLNYNPVSGYFKIDPAFPLSTQITYIPV